MEKNKRSNDLFGSSMMSNPKDKMVQTDRLQILGHLLRWDDVVIQISNISMISTGSYQSQSFPLWAAIVVIVGLITFWISWLIGLLLTVFGAAVIYLWYAEYQKTKNFKYLHILLNSGKSFSLLFQKENFLRKVLDVFANIFEDENSNAMYNIDIQNCTIDNHSALIHSASDATK